MTTIRLKRPFLSHGQQVTELTLREPTAAEVLRIGDLGDVHKSGLYVENPEAVHAYAELCIQHEMGGRAVLGLLGVADARQIREAVYRFFMDAAEPASASA